MLNPPITDFDEDCVHGRHPMFPVNQSYILIIKVLSPFLISYFGRKLMRWVVDGNKNQYRLDEELKVAYTIANEPELALLTQRGLSGKPEVIDNLNGYLVVRGASDGFWRGFLNL